MSATEKRRELRLWWLGHVGRENANSGATRVFKLDQCQGKGSEGDRGKDGHMW